MSAEIIDHPNKKRCATDLDVSSAIRDFTDAFIKALARADEGLATIETEGLRPATKHMVERFAEHLDELQEWGQRVTLTRNLARYQADLLERDGK